MRIIRNILLAIFFSSLIATLGCQKGTSSDGADETAELLKRLLPEKINLD